MSLEEQRRDDIPEPAAGMAGSEYLSMTVEEAARLLGGRRGRRTGVARAKAPRPRQSAPPLARQQQQARPAPDGKTEVHYISEIIAAAVGEVNSDLTVVLSAAAAAAQQLSKGHAALPYMRDVEQAVQRSAAKAARLLAFAQWSGARVGREPRGATLEGGGGI